MEEYIEKPERTILEPIPEGEIVDKYVHNFDHREETETEIIVYYKAVERKGWRPPEPPEPESEF